MVNQLDKKDGSKVGDEKEGQADANRFVRIDENGEKIVINEDGTRLEGPGTEKASKKEVKKEEKKEEKKFSFK